MLHVKSGALILLMALAASPAVAAPPVAAVPPAATVPLPVKLKVGDVAPLFMRSDFQGRVFDLKSQRGKIVLIDFWASWCPPCLIAIPHLNQLQNRFGQKGLQVVGISMDESAAITRQTMGKISFRYPVVLGDAKFGNLYGGVLGLPLQYLVGRDGKILSIWSGEVPPAALDKAIVAALEKSGNNK